jgi:hypothetical protein
MWEVLKTAITGVKDALGIEIPELPFDLGAIDVGSVGEAATTGLQGVTESVTGAIDEVAAMTGDAVGTNVAGVTQTVSDAPSLAADAAAQALPDGADAVRAGGGR